ncbi:MAG: hypothetical protein ACYCPH_00190 [Minisyncoccota bacterium]
MANKYLIQKKVKTPIEAEGPFDIHGFRIEPYREAFQDDLLVTREIEAPNGIEALKIFLTELEPILDSIAVTTQTMIFPLAMGSVLAYRLNDNPERLFFAQIAEESQIVGMTLTEEAIKDAEKLFAGKETVAMTYLREVINAFSSTHKLSMLISAAEALAGSAKVQGKCKECDATYEYPGTNKEALKQILGEKLYKQIYVETRIRHKLAHGGDAEMPEAVEIAEKMYSRIVLGYLKEKYKLDSLVEITGAPRGFTFEYSRSGCRMIVDGMPSLQQVEKEWDSHSHEYFYFDSLPNDY